MWLKPWSWLDAVAVARRNGGLLTIDWRWRNDQRRRAANRAVRHGALKRVRGKPGADYYELGDLPGDDVGGSGGGELKDGIEGGAAEDLAQADRGDDVKPDA